MSTRMRFTQTPLFRVIVAITLGIVCSFFLLEQLVRIFATFNGLFGNFPGFFIPALVFALIMPAIISLGRGVGKRLGIITAIVYGSTVFLGLLTYVATQGFYPWLLGADQAGASVDIDEDALGSFFNMEMPPPFDVMAALLLAFTVGVTMTAVKSDSFHRGATQLCDMIMKTISAFVIPLPPIYIFGMFLSMGTDGNLITTPLMSFKVLVLAVIGTVFLLATQFSIAGAIAGRSPWTFLKNMLPAYATALGTSSSAATIPVTYKAVLKNGVSEKVAGFIVPLCATIHLVGPMMKITLFVFAVMFMADKSLSPSMAVSFIPTLGIIIITAPGVPGGVIMTTVGVPQSMLGFDQEQIALTVAAYVAIDSFGTTCSVTGDDAIAMIVNRLAKDDIIDRSKELSFDAEEANPISSVTGA